MRKALIVIDVQNDYFEGGAFPLHQPEKALANILLLVKNFAAKNCPIYFIQHISKSKDAAFFLPDTNGVQLHASLKPFLLADQSETIEKAFPNSFKQTYLEDKLEEQKIDSLIICGMMTHMCVDSTTRQASDSGYSVTLISDACATRSLSFGEAVVSAIDVQNAFLSALSSFSKVESTEAFLS